MTSITSNVVTESNPRPAQRKASAEVVNTQAQDARRQAADVVAQQAARPAPRVDAAQVVERLNNAVKNVNSELRFSVDEELGRTLITIVDAETGEVIRQIPAEEVLKIARALADAGPVLFDKQA